MVTSDDEAARRALGRLLRAAREDLGYGQVDVASVMGVSTTTVSRWESGGQGIPASEVGRLLTFLGIPAAALLGLREGPPATATAAVGNAVPAKPPPWVKQMAAQLFETWTRKHASGEEMPIQTASAGAGTPTDHSEVAPLVARIQQAEGLQKGPLVPVEVIGDCLDPRLKPGWIAWVNPDARARPGDVVLAIVDGERMFKVLDRGEGRLLVLHALDGRDDIAVGPNAVVQGVVQLVQHAP